MKRLLVSVLITAVLFSGCSLFKKPPQEAVNEGFKKFTQVKKMTSLLSLKGARQAPAGEVPSRVQFSFDIKGQSDMSNVEAPVFDTDIDFSFTLDGQKISGDVQIRALDDKTYIKVADVKLPGEAAALLEPQLKTLLNVWWLLPTGQEGSVFKKFSEEQKKIHEKINNLTLFTSAVEDGKEDVEDVATTRYRVEVDKAALQQFIQDVASIGGTQLTPEESGALQAALTEIEFSGAASIGNDDVLHRIRGTFSAQPKQGASISVDLDYKGWDYGEDVVIEAPADAQEFNPLTILPLIGALGNLKLTEEKDVGTSTEPVVQPK